MTYARIHIFKVLGICSETGIGKAISSYIVKTKRMNDTCYNY